MRTNPKRPDFEAVASEQIAALRQAHGWSQSELARRMAEAGWPNYTQMTVSRTEKGERPIRLDELASYAEVFGRPLAELWLSVDEQAWQHSFTRRETAEDALMNALNEYATAVHHLALVTDSMQAAGDLSDARLERVRELVESSTPLELFHLSRVERYEDRQASEARFTAARAESTVRRLEGEISALWAEIYVASAEEARELREEDDDGSPSA